MDIIHSTQVASFHPELHLSFHPPFGADCIPHTLDVPAHLTEQSHDIDPTNAQ